MKFTIFLRKSCNFTIFYSKELQCGVKMSQFCNNSTKVVCETKEVGNFILKKDKNVLYGKVDLFFVYKFNSFYMRRKVWNKHLHECWKTVAVSAQICAASSWIRPDICRSVRGWIHTSQTVLQVSSTSQMKTWNLKVRTLRREKENRTWGDGQLPGAHCDGTPVAMETRVGRRAGRQGFGMN